MNFYRKFLVLLCVCTLLVQCGFFNSTCTSVIPHKNITLITASDSLMLDVWMGQDTDSNYAYIRPQTSSTHEQLASISVLVPSLPDPMLHVVQANDSLVSMALFYGKLLSTGDNINDSSLMACLFYYKGAKSMYVKAFTLGKGLSKEIKKLHIPVGIITTNDFALYADWLLADHTNIKFISTLDFTNNYALNNKPSIPPLASKFNLNN